jgi:streptogramin lyase
MHSGKGRSRFGALIALGTVGALAALLLVPGGAMAQKKKLKVSVKTSSQAQALNQGALKVSYKSKGLNKLSATATATRSGGGQVKLTQKATKNNPRNGTLSLRLTNAGDAALSECSSLTVRVEAKGKPNKSDNARANLAEDNRECAKPVKEFETETSTSYPTGIDVGPDGALWFAHSGAGQNSLGRMTTAGQYSNFHIPVPEGTPPGRTAGHSINDVVTGPDGAIWATPLGSDLGGAGASVVRRIDPATGAVTEYPLPNGVYLGSRLTVGPDGALWLTSQNPGQLFRITTTGEVT